jgi:hypothetical protein
MATLDLSDISHRVSVTDGFSDPCLPVLLGAIKRELQIPVLDKLNLRYWYHGEGPERRMAMIAIFPEVTFDFVMQPKRFLF